ncbi:acetylornithine deacetylase [Parvibaculum sp.]|uniref:acetylornithine deacetylase n=1 Tax=Parvibaculum sp. TaxID=2024848 RepID=UPI001E10D05B|nr:acetylornithine deacetylase [Parvibaculum sp.]MBX3490187.1 acetylornithine deacetylase [Parvibaculum sp.]MCW5725823.1 acetylornithine deacetylase [Parvibaculum sp.]
MPAPMRLSPREMIETLVSFDTTSHLSNLALVEFVENYLASHGVAAQRVTNEDGTKANLFATLGPADAAGGVVLSGHTDVVPVEGQDWSSDPFTVVQREGRLFGRGTSDMKSFIAVALAFVPEFLKDGPQIPVHLALSYDEEVGCLGVRPMIDGIIRTMPRPQVVIVGEPSSMKVVNAHKSIQSWSTTVTGLESHSSATDKGVNAVMYAAELIGFLSQMAEEMRRRGDASGRFRPPYTTVNVGPIRGGTALNIIPKTCSFLWEYRALPDLDPDEIINRFNAHVDENVLPRMRDVHPGARIETKVRAQAPGLAPEEGSAGETLVLKLAQCNAAEAVSYGTEAGLFQLADIPTVVCGPGDIAQAHKPDEFVELSQIAECERFMRRLADYVSGRPI